MTGAWPHPAPEDDGGARHLKPGMAVPDVSLSCIEGGMKSLRRLDGRWVVFIYPYTGRAGRADPPNWDNIAGAHGSTPEAQGFRDTYSAYRNLGYDIVGISGQPSNDQQEFAARMALPFALLSDQAGALRTALNLPHFETGGVIYLKRLTLLLDEGHIEQVIYPVHPPHTHARDLLAALKDE